MLDDEQRPAPADTHPGTGAAMQHEDGPAVQVQPAEMIPVRYPREQSEGFDDEDHDFGAGECADDKLFDGDEGTLARKIRDAIATIFTEKYISAEGSQAQRDAFKVAVNNREQVLAHFHNMWVDLVIDEPAGLIYKRRPDTEFDHRVVLEDGAYGREETLAMVFLRGVRRDTGSTSSSEVVVTTDEIVQALSNYASATNDTAAARTKSLNVVKRLRAEGILWPVRGEEDTWRISPIIEAILPLTKLEQLLEWVGAQIGEGAEGQPEAMSEEVA